MKYRIEKGKHKLYLAESDKALIETVHYHRDNAGNMIYTVTFKDGETAWCEDIGEIYKAIALKREGKDIPDYF